MTPMRWAGVAALLVAIGLGYWWHRTFELTEVTLPAPLVGEARINPLYGLQEVLAARGHTVLSRADLRGGALAEVDPQVLVLSADPARVSQALSSQLLEWVDRGGHLLVGLPAASPRRQAPLLEALGLDVNEHFSCLRWNYQVPVAARESVVRARAGEGGGLPGLPGTGDEDDDGPQSLCTARRLLTAQPGGRKQFDWLWGNGEEGFVFGRMRHGSGQIVFSGSLDFLRTPRLRDPANAALAWQLLGDSLRPEATVLLVYGTDLPPLHVLLVRHGWPVLLPLVLALLAWLWMRSQRFGPVLAERTIPRRALREHLRASAGLLLRRRSGGALLDPLRERVRGQLLARDPRYAGLGRQELSRLLARVYRLKPEAVDLALFDTSIHRPAALERAVRTLHRLSLDP